MVDDIILPGPEWPALKRALGTLAHRCGASLAFVLDTGNILWASAGRGFPRRHATADLVYDVEIVPRVASLRRGARIELARSDEGAHYFVRSFAATYALTLAFDGPFAEPAVRRDVGRALPEIEALILALPPPDGPGREAGEAKARAWRA